MRRIVLLLLPTLAGCATRPVAVADVAPPPVVAAPAPVAPPLPPGATPGMRIPAALPDGSYPTPNRQLTTAATLWHLRAGLNVAALACQGEQGATIIASYNALLKREKATLASAEASYAAEFRAGGGDWRDRYDDAMTRLYNYFSQTPARDGLCAAAQRTLAALETAPASALTADAASELAGIDRAFTDFYRAYDAWRDAAVPRAAAMVIASSSPPPAAPAPRPAVPAPSIASRTTASSPATPARQPARPRLDLDPSVFAIPVSPTR